MQETKPYSISKRAVIAAYERVKANKGTYGIDEQSIEDFEKKKQWQSRKRMEGLVFWEYQP